MSDFAIIWDWLAFAIRWTHVVTAICWIGSSFYFIALDLGLHRVRFGAATAAMQHDVMAGLGQTQGNGAPDTTAGAGDQYGFSHGVSSFDSSK